MCFVCGTPALMRFYSEHDMARALRRIPDPKPSIYEPSGDVDAHGNLRSPYLPPRAPAPSVASERAGAR